MYSCNFGKEENGTLYPNRLNYRINFENTKMMCGEIQIYQILWSKIDRFNLKIHFDRKKYAFSKFSWILQIIQTI